MNRIAEQLKRVHSRECICGIAMIMFLLVLLNACGFPGSTPASTNVSIVSPSHAAIVALAENNETAFIDGTDGVLTARRASDGNLLWSQQVSSHSPSQYLAATESALYDAYVENDSSVVEARQSSNGHLLWKQQVPRLGPQPLLVRDDMVYVNTYAKTSPGAVYALRASDGKVLWHYTSGRGATMDSFLYAAQGVAAIAYNNGVVHVFHAQDGSPILSYSCPLYTWWPSSDDGRIYIHCQYQALQAFRISDGKLLWTSRDSDQSFDIWTASQGKIFVETRDGTLKAFSGQDGSLLWHTSVSGTPISKPAVQDQLIYVITSDGLAAYHISNGTVAFAWKRSMGVVKYSPWYRDGVVFFGPDEHTISVWRGSDGKDLWHYTYAASILWYPHTANGIMYIRKGDGTLDVVRMNDGSILWHYLA